MWTIFHTEASLGWGGQEIRILNESIGMRDRGHKIITTGEAIREQLIKRNQVPPEKIMSIPTGGGS